MARRTAIRITNAEVAAAEHKTQARRDNAPSTERTPSTLDLMRAARGIMSEDELLQLAKDAAALEMRSYDAEDRKDAAAEAIWHVLAACDGSPPRRDSNLANIAHLRGLVRNYRRALDAKRRLADAAAETEAAEYAASEAWTLDGLVTDSGYLAAAAAQSIDAAHKLANDAADKLQLSRDGIVSEGVHAVFYQWIRDRTGEVCASECGVSHAAWKMRVNRGAKFIRANIGASRLLAILTEGDVQSAALFGNVRTTVTAGTTPPDVCQVSGAEGVYHVTDLYGDVFHAAEISDPVTGETTPAPLTFCHVDASRDASSHAGTWAGKLARDAAADWRDGTAGGSKPATPEDAAAAAAACNVTRQKPAPKMIAARRALLARDHVVKLADLKPGDRLVYARDSERHTGRRDAVTIAGRTRDRAMAQALRRAAAASVRPGMSERAVHYDAQHAA